MFSIVAGLRLYDKKLLDKASTLLKAAAGKSSRRHCCSDLCLTAIGEDLGAVDEA